MKSARTVYIILFLITVLPLFGFNFRRIFDKKEGEPRRVNKLKAVVLAVSVVALSAFIISLYNYTIKNQEFLLIENCTTILLKNANTGDLEGFIEEAAPFTIGDTGLKEQQDLPQLFSLLKENKNYGFQMSGYVRPKYYKDNSLFPEVEKAMQDMDNIFYAFIRVDNGQDDQHRPYLVFRVQSTQEGWRVCSIHQASNELTQYALDEKLISGEYALVWIKI